ncbi:MAG: fasciclin domain-containing protein [Chitinophagaceae bacterium]|nr:fasciclin domain-containing protein [Chitinophagaceae bacterium]
MQFINRNTIRKSWLPCLLLLFLNSCSRKESLTPPDALPGVLEYIQKTPSFSLLSYALTRSKLDEKLAEGNITVFAPPDSAFLQAGWTKEKLSQLTPDSIAFVLGYQILPGLVGSESIPGFYKTYPLTLNPSYKPNISKNYYGLYFDGNHVAHANIKMGDGIIHQVDALSFPATDSLLATLYRQPDLTIFSAIVKKVWNLSNQVQQENITLIVPNDKAFLDSGYTLQGVDTITDTMRLLRLCWPSMGESYRTGRLYGSDFIGGRLFYTEALYLPNPDPNEGSFAFFYRYNISLDGKEILPNFNNLVNGSTGIKIPPKFVRKNILSKGGIIHTVDQVFRP